MYGTSTSVHPDNSICMIQVLAYFLMIQYKWYTVMVGIRNDIMTVFASLCQLSVLFLSFSALETQSV